MTTATVTRTDQELQADVLAELRYDSSVKANEIGVSVKDGVVTLMGTVDTYLQKWRAEEAAHRVAGVTAVANDITVRTVDERTDADIAAAAVTALRWDAGLPTDSIHVTVDKGWVTIKGEVEWQFQRQEAEAANNPLRFRGVKGVSNLITVKPAVSPTGLKKKIEDALVRSAEVDANNISVEVQGSKAILKGRVRSWAERQEAERAAWLAPGITSIENQITIA